MSLTNDEINQVNDLCNFLAINNDEVSEIQYMLKSFEEHSDNTPSDKGQHVTMLMMSLKDKCQSLLKTIQQDNYSYDDVYDDLLPIVYTKLSFNHMNDEEKQLGDERLDDILYQLFSELLSKFILLYVFIKMIEQSTEEDNNAIKEFLENFGGDTHGEQVRSVTEKE